jgi:hypothetical protein
VEPSARAPLANWISKNTFHQEKHELLKREWELGRSEDVTGNRNSGHECIGGACLERVAEVKESIAVNKQLLAQYTWMEQDIISIKGEQKKEELYNVQLGPEGQPQKTPVDPSSMSDDERKRRGLRGRIIEKKIEEYKQYADQIKSLVQQYAFRRRKRCCNSPTSKET